MEILITRENREPDAINITPNFLVRLVDNNYPRYLTRQSLMKSNYFFSIVIAMLLLASPAMADSIVIETEGSNHYLTFQSDSLISISGYNVQLNFSPDTEIQAL